MIFSLLKIIRPINMFITALSVLLAVYIAGIESILFPPIINIIIASMFSCAAGNVINDIFDFNIDKINRPDRELPSGRLTVTQARIIYFFLIAASLIFAVAAGLKFFIFVFCANVLLFLYSYSFKKMLLVGNITVSATTALPLIIGGMAASNLTDVVIPALFAFFVNFMREIIKDIEDAKGDVLGSSNSFAIKYGERTTIQIFSAVTVLFMILTAIPFLTELYRIEYFLIIMIVVNPLFVYILKMLNKSHELSSYRKASGLIKLNMLFGIAAIVAGV